MKHQTVVSRKRPGPPPTGKGTLVGVRLQAGQIKAIDAWAAKQIPPVTRPEAIRGMIDAMLHILSKDAGDKPAKKAKIR